MLVLGYRHNVFVGGTFVLPGSNSKKRHRLSDDVAYVSKRFARLRWTPGSPGEDTAMCDFEWFMGGFAVLDEVANGTDGNEP
jgi:hypothetical protein